MVASTFRTKPAAVVVETLGSQLFRTCNEHLVLHLQHKIQNLNAMKRYQILALVKTMCVFDNH